MFATLRVLLKVIAHAFVRMRIYSLVTVAILVLYLIRFYVQVQKKSGRFFREINVHSSEFRWVLQQDGINAHMLLRAYTNNYNQYSSSRLTQFYEHRRDVISGVGADGCDGAHAAVSDFVPGPQQSLPLAATSVPT